MRPIYANEIDVIACAVLRTCYPGMTVDGRSIKDVSPNDLAGYEVCHFFAGAGLWEVARQMSGYAGPLWTASCPCQPFSIAGKGGGEDDPRHLWPDLLQLICAVRPSCVVGEQVANGLGEDWLNRVGLDLEGEGYVFRAVEIPACAVNAPHRRARNWWVAMADSYGSGHQGGQEDAQWGEIERDASKRASYWGDATLIACTDGRARRSKPGIRMLAYGMAGRSNLWGLAGNSIVPQVAAEVLRAIDGDQ